MVGIQPPSGGPTRSRERRRALLEVARQRCRECCGSVAPVVHDRRSRNDVLQRSTATIDEHHQRPDAEEEEADRQHDGAQRSAPRAQWRSVGVHHAQPDERLRHRVAGDRLRQPEVDEPVEHEPCDAEPARRCVVERPAEQHDEQVRRRRPHECVRPRDHEEIQAECAEARHRAGVSTTHRRRQPCGHIRRDRVWRARRQRCVVATHEPV